MATPPRPRPLAPRRPEAGNSLCRLYTHWHQRGQRAQITLLLLLTVPPAAAQSPEPRVRPGWDVERWFPFGSSFTLIVDPLPDPGEVLRVFADDVDLTALMEIEGNRWTFPAKLTRAVPSGERTVTVYRVSGSGEWQELGQFPLRLRTRSGFEQANLAPTLDLMGDGQWEGEELGAGPLQDSRSASLQATLASEHRRGAFALSSAFAVTGVPQREAALRFADLGERAPRVDLASYLMATAWGATQVSLGHVQFGQHRLIAQGFAARGAAVRLPLATGVSLELASTGGSAQVGWDDLLGLSQAHHRMRSATLNLTEWIPRELGNARLAFTWLDGSILPRAAFNEGAVTAAERSKGGGAQLSLTSSSHRLGMEAGWARMRLNPAFDKELEAGIEVEPVQSSRSDARYLEVQATFLERPGSGDSQPASLTLTIQHQRIDPLYRSVAAAAQADVDQLSGQLAAQLGAATAQLSWERTHDNLRCLPTVLGSQGERQGVHVALPFPQLFPGQAWLPSLQTGWEHTRTVGRSRDDTLFPPETVPDVNTRTLTAGLGWAIASWQLGYQLASSLARNGNVVERDATLESGSHALNLGVTLSPSVQLSLDAGRERVGQRGTGQVETSHRLGLLTSLRLSQALQCSARVSHTLATSRPDRDKRAGADMEIQLAYQFPLGLPAARASANVRLASSRQHARLPIFEFEEETRRWSTSLGLAVSLQP